MADSLILAGQFELAPGNTPTPWSGPTGGQPYVVDDSRDLGSPVPVVTIVESALVDGDRQSGTRTGNRQITLNIIVTATTRAALSAQTDALLSAVDVQSFTLQLTPDPGAGNPPLPVVFTCLRAVPTILWTRTLENQPGGVYQRNVSITMSALPFGRYPTATMISGAATRTVVATFDSPPGGSGDYVNSSGTLVATPWTTDTVNKTQGSGSATTMGASYNSETRSGSAKVFYNAAGAAVNISVTDFTQFASFDVDLRVDWPTGTAVTENATVLVVLYPGDGTSKQAQATGACTTGHFTTFSIPVSSFTGTAALTAITQFTVLVDARPGGALPTQIISPPSATGTVAPAQIWLDNAVGYPPSTGTVVSVANGGIVAINGVPGSAPAPTSVALTNSAGNLNSYVLYRSPVLAPADYIPLVPMSTSNNSDGTHTYYPGGTNVPRQWVDGTYTIVLATGTISGTASRTLTVNFVEVSNDTDSSTHTSQLTLTYTPSVSIVGGLLVVGQVTLPPRELPPDNTANTWQVTVSSTVTADTFADMLVLDTRGPAVMQVGTRSTANKYVDAPLPGFGLGFIGGGTDRAHAYSESGSAVASGGPLTVTPGNNQILSYSPQGAPVLTVGFFPQVRTERSS